MARPLPLHCPATSSFSFVNALTVGTAHIPIRAHARRGGQGQTVASPSARRSASMEVSAVHLTLVHVSPEQGLSRTIVDSHISGRAMEILKKPVGQDLTVPCLSVPRRSGSF